jgi:hypothetical protein
MSLSKSPYVKLTTGQLTVNPAGVGETEGLLTIGNNLRTDGKPHNEYRMRVIKSDTPSIGGRLYHESVNYVNNVGQTKLYLQYDHLVGKLSTPEASLFETQNHNVVGNANISGNLTVLGSLIAPGYTPVITSITSLDSTNIRNTNLTSINAKIRDLVATNITVDNFINNTIISDLTVDNLYTIDALMTNLTVVNPIVGTLASYPNTFSSLVATNLTNINANLSNVVAVDAQIHHIHYTHLTSVNAYADNLTLTTALTLLSIVDVS